METAFDNWIKKNLGETPGLTIARNGEAIVDNREPENITIEEENHGHLEVVGIKATPYGNDMEGTHTLCLTFVGRDSKEVSIHIEPLMAFRLVRSLLSQLDEECLSFVNDFNDENPAIREARH